ncbi:hypothetical protein AMAG_02112 [Allomyces macrogynus ATCC 38327]|uniref:ABC transporter domain-containing protein n=1 Tax=Allomyces macrogynus (strain ATCC 38327) TaxID=578462 RepID=A0A0L0S115_ALLM3|nr:hypothetical protein AMAG_02112 [Allomyces macrogynus ATCC 38327]|eukprot:KNE56287.1 hypothetical protein AMAG_02112 [Allomyces macrogynus ATCC 38327]
MTAADAPTVGAPDHAARRPTSPTLAAAAADHLAAHLRTSTLKLTEPEKSGLPPYINQMLVMLKRNWTLTMRSKKATLAQAVIAPIIFSLLLALLQRLYVVKQKSGTAHPKSYPLTGVLPCQGVTTSSPCITIMYTPDTPSTQLVMKTFVEKNAARTGAQLALESPALSDNTPPSKQMGVVAVPNPDFIYNYVVQNPNSTQFGVAFQSDLPNARYQLWYNTSQTVNGSDIYDVQLLSLQRGLDEALLAIAATPNALINPQQALTTQLTAGNLDVQIKDWPTIAPDTVPDTLVSQLGSMFFFCAVMVIFISVLQNIVTEKELKLRHAMETMGLKASVYWISQWLNLAVLVAVASLVTCIMGGPILKFTVFTDSNFAVMFLLFFVYGMAMISFGFFVTTFCRRARVAVLVGMFIFVIGLLFQSFVFSSSFVGFIWFNNPSTPIGYYYGLMFLPFYGFGLLFMSISAMTTGKFDVLTGTTIKGPGFQWSDLYRKLPSSVLPVYSTDGAAVDVPVPATFFYLMLMNIGVYSLLTWYLDKVIPDEYGRRYAPYFFLTPSYWGFGGNESTALNEFIDNNLPLGDREEFRVLDEDEDVAEERKRAFDRDLHVPMRIGNLRKVYRNNWFGTSKLDKVAVRSLCLTLEEGKLFALLGQNGAGKSTTMSCLSGLTPPTAGDAICFGASVTKNMDKIRSQMGICPQHDILFDSLTPVEHIELFGGLKNLSRAEIKKVTDERLEAVKLTKVKDHHSSTFSGGMKRRLSVVISTIGDPAIVFLDEPTTGMDPVNRRHVWSFLEEFKKGRIVVLTTHSMYEADILGDQIGIMVRGRMRALGSGIRLKNKFGAGYQVALTCTSSEKIARAKALVAREIPEAELQDDSAGSLMYRMPNSVTSKIPAFVKVLEGPEGKAIIESWGLSQTTLEEVFLKLIREATD